MQEVKIVRTLQILRAEPHGKGAPSLGICPVHSRRQSWAPCIGGKSSSFGIKKSPSVISHDATSKKGMRKISHQFANIPKKHQKWYVDSQRLGWQGMI